MFYTCAIISTGNRELVLSFNVCFTYKLPRNCMIVTDNYYAVSFLSSP